MTGIVEYGALLLQYSWLSDILFGKTKTNSIWYSSLACFGLATDNDFNQDYLYRMGMADSDSCPLSVHSIPTTRDHLHIKSVFFPGIYSQFGLAIHQNDHQPRRRFVEWAQNEIAVVPYFHKRILFSDEAHFWLNGYVNKQNCRIWSEANPQVYVETPLHQKKLNVWCASWAGGIIGPYFFKNDEGHNVTVNGDRYRAMITNFFIPELNNRDFQEL
ncbi:uncharacterized protein TNCV_3048221 [Trichonephila clavipes]|nr:uncharacterized protein TNCV_3048221 [Trichonephila clavipes]